MAAISSDLFMGLSPRTRGSRADLDQQHLERGPIPADAGEPMVAS